jgi:hypothetical protein
MYLIVRRKLVVFVVWSQVAITRMKSLGYKILVWRSLKGTTKVHYVV